MRLSGAATVVLGAGLVITASVAWFAYVGNSRNESRPLKLQVRQTAALLQAALPTVQTPLASAVELGASGTGHPQGFEDYLSSYIGEGKPFVSGVLWETGGTQPRGVASVGEPTVLPVARVAEFVSRARAGSKLMMTGPIRGNPYRLGYAFPSAGSGTAYVVYAEGDLPPRRRVTIQPGSPFRNLRFALYLGDRVRADRLLETNVDLPLHGRTATVVIPFGGSSLTIVAGSASHLGGTLTGFAWWITLLTGITITALAAGATQRLVRQRRSAERLTAEVQTLLGEQRTIAETLQRALLPKSLPEAPGVQISARYLPGVDGVEIGGDWYDVVPIGDRRFFFVVGDVSGRGVEAGSVMASLMFAGRAFASEGHQPDEVLNALGRLLDVARDKRFASVLCGIADVDGRALTMASAGHLAPVLASAERTEFVAVPTGPPIGVRNPDGYNAVTVPVPPGATVIAYTDGLVERRGESLDVGLRRLMEVVSTAEVGGDALVDRVMTELLEGARDDDTAILGFQWPS